MTRFVVSLFVACLIGAGFLWLTARGMPMVEVRAYLEGLDRAHLATWALVYVALYIVCHGARVVRWYELVRPLGPVEPIQVHRVCAVGFAAILLLPLRLGELVRPYLLARRTDFGMSAVLGTAVVERVIDGLIMTGLLFATLATYRGTQGTGFAYTAGALSAGIFLGALGICLVAMWRRELAHRLVMGTFGLVSEGIAEKLAGMLSDFIDGFRALVAARALGRFMGLTVVYWGSNAVSMWVLARWGFGLDVGLWDMCTVMALLVVGIMIPAGPAMAGNFEFFMKRALGLFVVAEFAGAALTAFAVCVHLLQIVVIVVPGLLVMGIDPEARHLIRLSRAAQDAEGAQG